MPREVTQTFPEPIFTPNPDYPPELEGQGVGGAVRLLLLVGSNGKVLGSQLQDDADPGFGREASEAVGFWTFKPAHQGDLNVPALYAANLIFSPH
jgi:protein TonB